MMTDHGPVGSSGNGWQMRSALKLATLFAYSVRVTIVNVERSIDEVFAYGTGSTRRVAEVELSDAAIPAD